MVRFSYTDFIQKEYFQSSWWTNKIVFGFESLKPESILHTFYTTPNILLWQANISERISGRANTRYEPHNLYFLNYYLLKAFRTQIQIYTHFFFRFHLFVWCFYWSDSDSFIYERWNSNSNKFIESSRLFFYSFFDV